MANPEQVQAPNYPESETQIALNRFDCVYFDALFDIAIDSHGNGDECTWSSYALEDIETFTVRRYGASSVGPEETEGLPISKWALKFKTREKILLFDAGAITVERYEGEFTVPGSFKDVSDLVAAVINLKLLSAERRNQGWSLRLDGMINDLKEGGDPFL